MFPVKWNKLQLAADINRSGMGERRERERTHRLELKQWNIRNSPLCEGFSFERKFLPDARWEKEKRFSELSQQPTSCVGASTRRYPREQLSERARKFLRREEKPGKVFAWKRGNCCWGGNRVFAQCWRAESSKSPAERKPKRNFNSNFVYLPIESLHT